MKKEKNKKYIMKKKKQNYQTIIKLFSLERDIVLIWDH